jgi:hypothetical protein
MAAGGPEVGQIAKMTNNVRGYDHNKFQQNSPVVTKCALPTYDDGLHVIATSSPGELMIPIYTNKKNWT